MQVVESVLGRPLFLPVTAEEKLEDILRRTNPLCLELSYVFLYELVLSSSCCTDSPSGLILVKRERFALLRGMVSKMLTDQPVICHLHHGAKIHSKVSHVLTILRERER